MVEALLAKGADVNTKSKYGGTPLSSACDSGRLEVVRVLLANGANVNAMDDFGETVLWKACAGGKVCEGGNPAIVEALLAKGADVNARRKKDGYTAIFAAALEGHIDVVKVLLNNGVDINSKSNDGETPLRAAIGNGRIAMVTELLARGANVNASSREGETALMAASSIRGYSEVVRQLLDKGADVNAKNNNGWTALELAKKAWSKDVRVISLLEEAVARRSGCYATGHDWNYCVCSRCGEKRETGHRYGQDRSCSKCGKVRDLIGMTVVVAGYSLQAPLKTASERDRSFFCVSRASYDADAFDGFWLIDGTRGTTGSFVIEKVLDETPAWAISKYPRIASVVRRSF